MNCDEAARLLASHADGELGLPHAGELEDHLEACAGCRAKLAALTELRAGVRMHANYHAAPAAFAAQIRSALRSDVAPMPPAMSVDRVADASPRHAASGRWRWQWPQIGAAFATAFALVWSVGIYVVLPGADESLEKELVASHARSLMVDHALDVASTDQHTVKPWFNGKLDFSPVVVDLADQGYTLTGGRLDYIGQRPVAALVYMRRQHPINLFVWPAEKTNAPINTTRQGYNLLHWTRNATAYWAVSDLNPAELAQFRDSLIQVSQ
jgi:anti-sigma factor RsiW